MQWIEAPINQVCRIVNGGTPKTKVPSYWDGPYNWITPAEMGKRKSPFVRETRRTLSEDGLAHCSAKMLPEKSVILSARAPIGHLVINEVPMATNQGCKGLIPSDSLFYKYLYFFLMANVDLLNSLGTGTTFKELSATKLKGVSIPLPPLPEQKHIVEILDEAFEAIDKAIANTERNIKNAEELFESNRDAVLTKADSSWKSSTLGDICRIQRGGSPRPIKQYLTERDDGINWIKIADASAGHKYITKTGQKIIPEGIQRSRLVHPGEFLLSNSMSFGRPYILKIEGCIHDGWLVLGDFQSELTEDYLYHFLSSGEAKLQLERLAVGSTVRNLNTNSVSKVSIRYPVMKEQSVICAHLDTLDARSRDLAKQATSKKLLLDDLKQSILQKAFTGELTKDFRAVDKALSEAGA